MNKSFGIPKNKIKRDTQVKVDDSDRYNALVLANQNLALSKAAGLFGGDAIIPPIEFSNPYNTGGLGLGFDIGNGDVGSWPGRYGYGMYGQYGIGGWIYNKTGQSVDHTRMAACVLLYKTEGVVQRIVHLLADFATEGLSIEHRDSSVKNFYKAWAKKVALKRRVYRIIVDMLVTGNVFVWRKEAKLKPVEKQAMKRGQAYVIKDQLYDDKHRSIGDLTKDISKTNKIPWGYTSLNPLQMDLRGSRFAGDHYWVMLLTRDDVKRLTGKSTDRRGYLDNIGDSEVNIPSEFQGKVFSIKKPIGGYTHELKLDSNRLTVLHDVTKADYEAWATPQIYPAHKEIMFKRLMRAGELSAVESMKHMITLIKLGDTKEGLAPTAEHIERVASALAAGAQSHYLIWDDLIKGEVLQPDIGKILDPRKYEAIDKDIFMSLGVNESVMTGKGNYSNSFLSIKLLLEKLETIREIIMDWLLFELKIVAEYMNFRILPKVKFGLMNLRDDNAERKLLIDLFDRGVISQETFLEYFDIDYSYERTRQLTEKKNIEVDNEEEGGEESDIKQPVMVPTGPFRRNEKSQPRSFKGPGGRPGNDGKPQEVDRNTKPQGMSQLLNYDKLRTFVVDALQIAKKCISDHYCELTEVNDVRFLTKAQKNSLDQLIFMTASILDPNSKVTTSLVYNKLGIVRTEGIKSTNIVYKTFCEIIPTLKTKTEIENAFCTLYAMIHSGISNDEGKETIISKDSRDNS